MIRILTASLFLGVLAQGPSVSWAQADEVTAAVAANFAGPAKELASRFEKSKGVHVDIISGSTGKLAAQILNGAPFQILLSADQETPQLLESKDFALKGSRFTYAVGNLVLWSASASKVDPQGEILKKGSFERIAIAKPGLAPYGRAAEEVLKRLGLFEKLGTKRIEAENINQAFQYAVTGTVDLAFVARSQVVGEFGGKGSLWNVPESLHSPIRQDAVLLSKGKGNAAAEAFLQFLGTEESKRYIRSQGYRVD